MHIPLKKIFISFIMSLLVTNAFLLLHTLKRNYHSKPKNTCYGIASWYGPGFHGRRTANGEVFNQNELTAAHKTLPFNTKVLVTNLKSNKSIVVRINDRGPFIEGREIDLSYKSAERIGSITQGVAHVKLEIF